MLRSNDNNAKEMDLGWVYLLSFFFLIFFVTFNIVGSGFSKQTITGLVGDESKRNILSEWPYEQKSGLE